jgi:hypothetical protein
MTLKVSNLASDADFDIDMYKKAVMRPSKHSEMEKIRTTFGSEKACFSPTKTESFTSSATPSFSRLSRHCAIAVSSGDKKEVFEG